VQLVQLAEEEAPAVVEYMPMPHSMQIDDPEAIK